VLRLQPTSSPRCDSPLSARCRHSGSRSIAPVGSCLCCHRFRARFVAGAALARRRGSKTWAEVGFRRRVLSCPRTRPLHAAYVTGLLGPLRSSPLILARLCERGSRWPAIENFTVLLTDLVGSTEMASTISLESVAASSTPMSAANRGSARRRRSGVVEAPRGADGRHLDSLVFPILGTLPSAASSGLGDRDLLGGLRPLGSEGGSLGSRGHGSGRTTSPPHW